MPVPTGLASQAPQLTGGDEQAGRVLVDIDDTIIEVHGHAKQGSGYGYTKVRGLNALLATVSIAGAAPVIVAQRLRKGSCGSARGAKLLVADALKTVRTLRRRLRAGAVCAATHHRPGLRRALPLGCNKRFRRAHHHLRGSRRTRLPGATADPSGPEPLALLRATRGLVRR